MHNLRQILSDIFSNRYNINQGLKNSKLKKRDPFMIFLISLCKRVQINNLIRMEESFLFLMG